MHVAQRSGAWSHAPAVVWSAINPDKMSERGIHRRHPRIDRLFDLVIKERMRTSPHNILGDGIPIKVPRTVAMDGVIAANTEFAPA